MENYGTDSEFPAGGNTQPESQVETMQTLTAVLSLVEELPGEQREVFLLKVEAGMTLDDIAALTGVNAETAKSRLRYAIKKLRSGTNE